MHRLSVKLCMYSWITYNKHASAVTDYTLLTILIIACTCDETVTVNHFSGDFSHLRITL